MANKQLDKINHPNDIKKLTTKECVELADEIRTMIKDVASKKDVHFSSNMGVVELTISILRIFDIEKDTILYDTGHQTYAHKILTDRKDRFNTIKEKDGISGLMNMRESRFDHYSPGHSGNILSVASGLYQKYIDNNKGSNGLYLNQKNIICVVGDSAFANGLNFEALNDISYKNEPIIIILNDNDMSISKSVGAMSRVFNKLKTNRVFHFFERLIRYLFGYGKFYNFIFKMFYWCQWKITGKNLIEDLGFNYIGPINGHKIKSINKALERANWFAKQGPVVVHVRTKKGKGDSSAELDTKGDYHSLIHNNKKSYGMFATDFIIELMRKHDDIRVINPAMTNASNCDKIADEFSKYYFDVGIAEEHAISKASGMNLNGLKPFIYIYSTFLQRTYDQLMHDFSRLNLACTLLIDRADLAPSEGSSHHGIYDIGLLKSVPNTTITAPRNIEQLRQLINISYYENKERIFAIRYPKSDSLKLEYNLDFKIKWGSWEWMHKTNNKTIIISYGPNINLIYENVAKKYNVNLINAIFINDYDESYLKEIFNNYDNIIVYERIYSNLGLVNDLYLYKAKNNLKSNIHEFNFSSGIQYGIQSDLDKQQSMDIDSLINLVKTIA